MLSLVLALLLLLLPLPASANSVDQWLEDFRQIVAEMSSHYANLDSALEDRRIDLPALRKRTEERIRAAKNDAEAQQAIDSFLSAFGDGHADVRWKRPAAPPAQTPPTAGSSSPAPRPSLCARLGYESRPPRGIDFAQLPGYTAIDDPDARDFPGGILALGKRKAGIVRIHLFSETVHPELCAAAQQALGLADDAACEGPCDHRLELATADLLTAALERRLESLARAGATTLVVDLTGNGGGSNWVEPAARVMTRVPLQSPRLGFLRHPHWSKQLRERLEDVTYDLSHGGEPRPLLEQAERTLRQAIAASEEPCDRSGLWSDPPQKPSCSTLVRGLLYASGVLPYAKPGTFAPSLHAAGVLFGPSRYHYREGVNRLPIVILTDGGTASAAEYFAAMLKDNGAATLAGLPTRGSGCGRTNGGIPFTLPGSGGELHLPDCVRFRADGTNEVVGVTPDVLIPWSDFDSRYQRAAKTAKALEALVR